MRKKDSSNNDLRTDVNANTRNRYLRSQKSVSVSEKISNNAWKVLAILSLIATMVTYAETMLIPAIPDLIRDFHISYNTSSWLMTMYLLAGAVMTPIAGKLSDIHGRKKILLIIMIIYAIGVSIAASSNTFYIMLVARAFQGVGMGMFPIAYTMIRSQFPRTKISIGQGIITSMYASGSVIGLVIGGSIIQYYGWHVTFITVIPVSIVLLVTIWKYVNVKDHRYDNDDSTNINKIKRAPLDIKGAITLGIAIVSILLVFTFLQPQSQHQNPAASSSSASFLIENSN